jgi:hypothetical protein
VIKVTVAAAEPRVASSVASIFKACALFLFEPILNKDEAESLASIVF